MLYFGMPAAFVETTDIWLEPCRALAVTWAVHSPGLSWLVRRRSS
jgi:hypothetical protein